MNDAEVAEVAGLSLRELAELLRTRRLSAREALAAHLARIEAVNPRLNAVVTVAAEAAQAAAERADQLAASGAELPPLHGVPMTHKDTHDTAELRTTWGSTVYRDRVPTADSLVVTRLKAAGVITTGKNNVPELAVGSHTFNPLFGTTRNPWDPSRSAGGSSGGVAAAVAGGIQPAGDASDMGGSIRIPAAFTHLVGLRPSLGRVPTVPPTGSTGWLARVGGIARTADDLALVMSVIAGPDPVDPDSYPEPGSVFVPPTRTDLRGLRVGWTPDLGRDDVPVEPAVLAVLDRAVERLVELGADVRAAGPDLRDAPEVFDVTRAAALAAAWGDVVGTRPAEFKEAVRWNVRRGLELTAGQRESARLARDRLRAATDRFFGSFDLLVTPAAPVLPFDADLEFPDRIAGVPTPHYLDWMRVATLISATGLPAMSVPAGFDAGTGLPVGMQVVAGHGRDGLLIEFAHAVGQAELRVPRP